MANETFSASEIKRQASRLRYQVDRYVTATKKIEDLLLEIFTTVKSEDSSLGERIQKLWGAYTNLNDVKIKNKFINIAELMENWANKTISNESETTTSVASSKTDLEFINHILSLVK